MKCAGAVILVEQLLELLHSHTRETPFHDIVMAIEKVTALVKS
jgi:hypothetical protein